MQVQSEPAAEAAPATNLETEIEITSDDITQKLYPEGAEAKAPETDAEKDEAEPAKTVETKEAEEGGTESEDTKTEEAKVTEYKLEAPTDSKLSSEDLADISDLAKELSLTKEQAQEVVDSQSDTINRFVKKAEETHWQEVKEWEKSLKDDPDFGGQNYDKTVAMAQKSFEKFASTDLRKVMVEKGFGSYPDIVKMFARIQGEMESDRMVSSQETSGSTQSYADKIYDKTKT